MEKDLCEVDPGLGINLYAPTNPSNYNCQIGVFVEDI